MKRIGMLLDYYHNITMLSLVDELQQECQREGYQLFLFEGRPIDMPDDVIKGYHSVYSTIQKESLDGLIVVSLSLINPDSVEKLIDFLVHLQIPVVTVGRKIGSFPVVLTDNFSGITSVFHHLYGHNKRNIAFVSGEIRQKDGLDRLNQYKKLLKEYNMNVDEDLIFYGNFVKKDGQDAALKFEKKIKSKEIDSIIFSNDSMASGALDALKKMGIRCPEDVAITGYDNVSWTALCEPPLTTVSQNYVEMAVHVFDVMKQCILEKPVEDSTLVPATLIVRTSCGCDSMQPQFNNEGLTGFAAEEIFFSEQIQTYEIQLLLTRLQQTLTYHGIHDFVIVNYSKPLLFDNFYTLELPEYSNIFFALVGGELIETEKAFLTYQILPDILIEKMNATTLIVKPLFFANEIFGYCVAPCSADNDRLLSEIRLYVSDHIKGTMLLQEHIDMETRLNETLEELKSVNKKLSILSNRDELTGLYNRRGFFIESASYLKENQKDYYLIIYIDMDNLKNINDNFGHEEGDVAITMVAKLLSESVRENDIVCRQSGDEFIVFIKEAKKEMIPFFEARFAEKIAKMNADSKKDYQVDFSWGFVYANRCEDLDECLRVADEKMLASKKRKKNGMHED